jgi:hypothetical protein
MSISQRLDLITAIYFLLASAGFWVSGNQAMGMSLFAPGMVFLLLSDQNRAVRG